LLNAADFPYKPFVMIAIAAIALVAIAAYATQLGFHERMARFGLALILGGAFGNLIDRAIAGYVVDFVDVYWGNTQFWAVNVADSAITIGAIVVLLDMIGIGRQHASPPVRNRTIPGLHVRRAARSCLSPRAPVRAGPRPATRFGSE